MLEVLHEPAVREFRNPPLLFIHGSYCAAWIWAEHYLPFFGGHGYACYALSLRGHGGSPGRAEWATLADYIADVALIAAALPRPPVLIGHSLGGLIAQHAVSAGRPANGLVMLASTPPSGLASSSLHMMAHAPEVLFQLGLLQMMGPAALAMPVLHRALFSKHMPLLAGRAMLARLQMESSLLAAELLLPLSPRRPTAGDLPALVAGGDADLFLPVSALNESAGHWRAEKHVLVGAPHALMIDSHYWRPSAEIILDWLERQKPGARGA